MRHAFLLTAGVLSAALVGAATMLAASSAGAAPLARPRIQAGTGKAELIHRRCWWRYGVRHCHRHGSVVIGPRVYVGPNVVVRVR